MRYLTEKGQGFYWEDPSDSANAITVFFNQGGGLSVAVAEEKAVGSYNEDFECTAFLTREDAEKLRDYLCDELGLPQSPAVGQGAVK